MYHSEKKTLASLSKIVLRGVDAGRNRALVHFKTFDQKQIGVVEHKTLFEVAQIYRDNVQFQKSDKLKQSVMSATIHVM